MSAFDGIDPVQAQAIRRALKKELERELTAELSEGIRRKIERDIRDETRSEVLEEVRAREPTEKEREQFREYVNEVRLDAYAQATMASEAADEAETALERSRRLANPLVALLVIGFPLAAAWGASELGGFQSVTFVAAGLTALLAVLTLWIGSLRKHFRLDGQKTKQRKIASDFLIIAERAKAFAMVHAEQLTSAVELAKLREGLRRDKERQDRVFHPSASALAAVRERVRPRIAAEGRQRIEIGLDGDAETLSEEPVTRRTRAR